jgi:hypothetical protein
MAGAKDAPAFVADAALEQIEVDAARVAIGLDLSLAKESRP